MRKFEKHTKNLILFLYFIFAFIIAYRTAFPLGFETKFFGSIDLNASNDILIEGLGLSDPGNYMRVAVDVQDLTISLENKWILGLWPPGMPGYLAFLTFISGGGNPTAIATLVFITLWSVLYAILVSVLISKRFILLTLGFSYIWLFSPLLTGYNTDYGVLSSDGISSIIMAFAVIIAFKLFSVHQSSSSKVIVLSTLLGFTLAIAAHFRMVWTFSIFAAIFFSYVLYFLIGLLIRYSKLGNLTSKRTDLLFPFSITSVVFVLLLIPWTLVAEAKIHPGNYNWSNGNYVWAQRWMSDQYLLDGGASFLVEGNANWSCEIDKEQCAEISQVEISAGSFYSGSGPFSHAELRNRALMSAVENPLHWLKIMTSKLVETWVTIPGAPIGSAPNLLGGTLTILAYLTSLFYLLRSILSTNNIFALFLFFTSTFTVAILYLEHFESRYLIPTQTLALVILVFYLGGKAKSDSYRNRLLEFKHRLLW